MIFNKILVNDLFLIGFIMKECKISSIFILRSLGLIVQSKIGIRSANQYIKTLVLFWNMRYVIIVKNIFPDM